MKYKEVCKISICPLTYETLDPKYHSRNKRNVLKYKSDYEQQTIKFSLAYSQTRYIKCLAKD